MLGSVHLRCLIVDDNASFLEASRGLLERQGVAVLGVAMTASEALRRAEELEPDVILVDVDLGDDSGFDLARELAQSAREVSPNLILISGYPEEDFADLVAESPAVGFVAKSDLSRRVLEELLLRSGSSDGA